MKGKIAVQETLEQLKEKLEQAGYQVVNWEKATEPVAAIVYSGVTCEWEGKMAVENAAMTWHQVQGEQDVVMINIAQMTPEEALDLIKSRI